jgi:glutamate carboxypeptidase
MNRWHFFLTLIILTAFTSVSIAQKISRTEKKILEIVSKNQGQAIEFLEKVVNMNSGTMNIDGVRQVGVEFDVALKALGFTTRWSEMPDEMNRAGHLFAERKGSKGKKLLLIGHLDTVFEKDSPFQIYVAQDTIALGPGAEDMKGGDVIMLYALRALYEAGVLDDTQIIIALHGDEEETGKPISISRKDIIDAGKRSDIALGFEGSTGFNDATVARRGSSGWKLEVTGRRAHSAGIFSDEDGTGAIFEMSRILHQFYEQLHAEEFLTFNPGVMLAGTFVDYDDANFKGTAYGKSNVIPQSAVVTGGLRFISEDQKEKTRVTMKEIVANNYPKTGAEIIFWDSYPAMPPTDGNTQVMEVLSQVSVDMNQGEVVAFDPLKRGAADISFVAKYTDGIDGLGAMGGGGHTPQEYVDLTTFETLTKRTAILIYRLTR